MINDDQNECGRGRDRKRWRERIYFDGNSNVYENGNEMMQIFLKPMK